VGSAHDHVAAGNGHDVIADKAAKTAPEDHPRASPSSG
jgi:hypothetical protein